MCGARMRLLVLALVFITTLNSCLVAKAFKVDLHKGEWRLYGRRVLVDNNNNQVNAEYEIVNPSEWGDRSKAKYERNKPHVNAGTIGHVDEGRGQGVADNVVNSKDDQYPPSNVDNHHHIPRQDFSPYGGDATGGGR